MSFVSFGDLGGRFDGRAGFARPPGVRADVALLAACQRQRVEFVRLDAYARELLAARAAIPVCDQVLAEIDGRSGVVATQVA